MKKVISDYSGIIFKTFLDVFEHFINSGYTFRTYGIMLDKKNYKVLNHWKDSEEENAYVLKLLLGKKIFYCYIDLCDDLWARHNDNIISCFAIDAKYKHDIIFIIPSSNCCCIDWYHNDNFWYIEFICVCKSNGLYWICVLQCRIQNFNSILLLKEKMKLSKLFDVEPKNISIRKERLTHIKVDIQNYGKVSCLFEMYRYTQDERDREDRFEYIFANI